MTRLSWSTNYGDCETDDFEKKDYDYSDGFFLNNTPFKVLSDQKFTNASQ